ncbi:MAG: hypothetical protein WC980_05295 [Candidatus Brocadiia bacterium]
MKHYYLALLLLLIISAGCAGPMEITRTLDVNDTYVQDVKKISGLNQNVVLAPIHIDPAPDQPVKDEKFVMLEPELLTTQLMETFRSYMVFDKLEKIPATVKTKKELIAEARAKEATLIMSLTVKKYRIYYIGGSDATLGNTVLWFFGTIPCFWTHDQMYGVEITAETSFLDLATSEEFALPLTSYTTTFKVEGSLSFLERGFSPLILILPPQLCSINWNNIQELVNQKASSYFLIKLAEQTKKELLQKLSS